MKNLLAHIDPLLRGESDIHPSGAERSTMSIIGQGGLIVLFVMVYGGVMGSWGLFAPSGGGQWLVSLYSALKAPLLLLATFLLSLPVLFISYTLAGLRSDLTQVVHHLMETQGVLAIILGGLAPCTLFWYASVSDYQIGVLFNALMFALATLTAPLPMIRHYRRLVSESPRHRHLLRFWLVVYVFIGIQMGWVLRPFIGSPGSEVTFLRWNDLDNAYVTVAEMIWRVVW
jgi:hypothetical protein